MYAIRTLPWGAMEIVEFEPTKKVGSYLCSENEQHHMNNCFGTFKEAKDDAVLRARDLLECAWRRLDAAQVDLEKILASTGPTR